MRKNEKRDQEIFRQILDGKTTKEVAASAGISANRVLEIVKAVGWRGPIKRARDLCRFDTNVTTLRKYPELYIRLLRGDQVKAVFSDEWQSTWCWEHSLPGYCSRGWEPYAVGTRKRRDYTASYERYIESRAFYIKRRKAVDLLLSGWSWMDYKNRIDAAT